MIHAAAVVTMVRGAGAAIVNRLRANLIIIALRVMTLAAGLLYLKAYSSVLTTDEIGTFFYLSTLSYSLNALVFLPVDFYMQARLATYDAIPHVAVFRLVASTIAIGLLCCGFVTAPFVGVDKLRIADLPWIFAVAVLLYLCTTFRNLLNNRGSSVFVSVMLLMESSGRLIGFLAMSPVAGSTALTMMMSSAVALAAELVVILWQCRSVLMLSPEPKQLDTLRVVVHSALSLSGSAVSNTVQLQTYRVIYPLFSLSTISGIYGVVANVGASAMAACASVFSQIELPRLYRSKGQSITSFVKLAIMLSVSVFAVALICRSFLIDHLTQAKYVPYSAAIVFGVIVEACNLILGGYAVYLMLYRRTTFLLILHLLGALISVAGSLVSLKWYSHSSVAIGIAVGGSQLLITSAMGVVVERHKAGVKSCFVTR